MGVRLVDIAKEAGVSVATVSRVLNHLKGVEEGRRKRVRRAAERLGYEPDGVARSLRTKRTYTLGIVLPNIANTYFAETVRGIQDAALESGYTLLVASSDGDPVKENAALTALSYRRVDGVVLVSAAVDSSPSAELLRLLANGTPVVAMDRSLHHPDVCRVLVDTRGGARAAVEHLVSRGRRRIAFLAGPPAIWTAEEKLMGYHEGLIAAGLTIEPSLVLQGGYTIEGGEERAMDLLELRPIPDAVLIANNLMTLGAYRVLLRRDVAIPRDIAVVGYDNVPWTDVVRPALSVVAQPTHELGRRAVEVLMRRLSEHSSSVRSTIDILPTQLVIRESS